jgi:hypothetical protein
VTNQDDFFHVAPHALSFTLMGRKGKISGFGFPEAAADSSYLNIYQIMVKK